MRKAFVESIVKLAHEDERIVLLTADLGYTVLESFAEKFPRRFFNVGVAEQNMLCVATGLAEAGFIPYVYSIGTFAVARPYEFIRNGPVLHQLPVRIIGVGAGFDYGTAGGTHHVIDDVAILRAQPGIRIFVPSDAQQARTILVATWNLPGPSYYRLGKDDHAVIPGLDGRFHLDAAELVAQGGDVLLIATGAIALEASQAVADLRAQGVECTLLVVAGLQPAPVENLIKHLSRFKFVLSVEVHVLNGGLGSILCELIAEHGLPCRLKRLGIRFGVDGPHWVGDAKWLATQHGLSASQIAAAARACIH